ncbi:GNAT family N-acetyltransferase [Thiotrichales bacterium 19S3-7]|nr:GNAT family N-acetyltransferase [Thiotrichales bacterium 19S3-7]MCF6800645.1 GNAT family N-acetyltransferase [Thiotrichales bacterium 19S3-11]
MNAINAIVDEMKNLQLEGRTVSLVALSIDKTDDLVEAVNDGKLYQLWYTHIPHPQQMKQEIIRRCALRDQNKMIPFAVIDKKTNKASGMTTFMNLDLGNRRLEIGSTWYRQSLQGSALNTEAKLLLLTYAFEKLECVAVEFRTHLFNRKSRAAIEALGAKLDGILRSHMILSDGSLRDTCVYSILKSEWSSVKNALEYRFSQKLNPRI